MDRDLSTHEAASYMAEMDEIRADSFGLDEADLYLGEEPTTEQDFPPQCDLGRIQEDRRNYRRDKAIHAALQNNHSLSWAAQENLLKIHFSKGWARFTHGMSRHFKSPTRYGHKLVDIAVLFTVHDRTVALVKPVMFAAITAKEFEDETGMDESNVRKSLKSLVTKGALIKIEGAPGIIFWALNPHYFAIRGSGESPRGKLPQGKPPGGISPRSKKGDSPRVNTGQSTPGQSSQTAGNQNEISDAKNPSEESQKESLLCGGEFPEDMRKRWTRFQETGLGSRIKKEREIFEKLFLIHGDTFFNFCGRVVEFLEQRGTGKSGEGGQIHHPMSWLEGHWETNLALYQIWKAQKEELDRAHALKLDREAKLKAVEAEKARLQEIENRKTIEWKEQLDAAAERFLSLYPGVDEVRSFSAEAIEILGCSFTQNAWKKNGWDSPLARSCILDHFMKVESGVRTTQVQPRGTRRFA